MHGNLFSFLRSSLLLLSTCPLQIGKSGASWITQAFLLGCGSIAAAMPFTGFIFAGVIITWIKVRGGEECGEGGFVGREGGKGSQEGGRYEGESTRHTGRPAVPCCVMLWCNAFSLAVDLCACLFVCV